MSATINTAPNPAASSVQVAMNGANSTESTAVAANAGDTESNVGSFGALFKQLLGKEPVADADSGTFIFPADATKGTDPSTDGTLAALLPFLEGMGLVQTDTAQAGKNLKDIPEDTDETPLAGFASALTAQITVTADTAAQPNSKLATLPPALADTKSPLEAQTAKLLADNASDQGQPVTKELSSRFAAALEAAGDKASAGATLQPAGTPLAQLPVATNQTLPVEHPVGAAGWGPEVGNRLVWMANRAESHAELVLTPPHMGRVEVSLSVNGDQASATFVSSNPAVREALEAAMPRLRETLADAGIQLGQAQVGAENAHQSAQDEKSRDNSKLGRDASPDAKSLQSIAATLPASSTGLKMGKGLVDVFA